MGRPETDPVSLEQVARMIKDLASSHRYSAPGLQQGGSVGWARGAMTRQGGCAQVVRHGPAEVRCSSR